MAFVKLNNRSSQRTNLFDAVICSDGADLLEKTLGSFELLLTSVAVAECLFELACCDLVEAHADQIIRVNLRDGVGLFDQLKAPLAV